MDSNLKLFLTVITGASFMFSGCSNDKDLPIENITIVEEGNAKPAQKAESTHPTAILGTGGSISGLLSKTFTNIVEPAKAKHVIVACDELDTYKEELVDAYKRGIVITIVDPVGSVVEGWCAANEMIYAGAPGAVDRATLVSFNRKAVTMSLQKKDKGELIEEDEVPLVIFTGWLDDVLKVNLKGPDFRSKDIRKRFAPQRVNHVFPIDIPMDQINGSGWGVPENVSLQATAELACDIYPIHSFADNASFTGDLYAVEAELTIHNGNLYNGRWQYSQGGKLYESCGFYLSDCGLTTYLYNRKDNGLIISDTHMLAGGPAPESTESSSPLQTGFEWSFDGWITGGNGLESSTPTPIQNGVWTWNNIAETLDSGLDITTQTNGGNVKWNFVVADLPADRETAVPAAASGDLKFHCSWIWAVPQATDDSDDRYYMMVSLNPIYSWTRSLLPSTGIDSKSLTPEVPSAIFMLIPPSRKEGQRI